jgi:DNA-binding GntR family transcriptional regulator
VPRLEAAHVTALSESIAALRALPLDGALTIQSFNDNDRTFHHLLIEISHNSFLIDMYDTLSPHIHIGRFYYDGGVLAAQAIIDEHSAIVAAYRQYDTTGAVERTRAHLMAARARLSEALRTRVAKE